MIDDASVCIYCGSRSGARPAYAKAAEGLGEALGKSGRTVIYGAGDLGLMGIAARAAHAAGGKVIGFIPRHIIDLEVGRSDIHAMIVTETMHERKKLMFTNAEAVVALPGGAGTLDELVEVLTWRQLGLHRKPVVLLNVEGYWEPFLTLLRHMHNEGFLNAGFFDFLSMATTVEEAMAYLARKT